MASSSMIKYSEIQSQLMQGDAHAVVEPRAVGRCPHLPPVRDLAPPPRACTPLPTRKTPPHERPTAGPPPRRGTPPAPLHAPGSTPPGKPEARWVGKAWSGQEN